VVAINVTDTVIDVYSEVPSRGWANPSFVGPDEIMTIEWADESAPAKGGAG